MSESAIDIAAAGDAPANAADDVGGDSEKNESNKAASPSSNASCLKKYRFQFPVFNDMVRCCARADYRPPQYKSYSSALPHGV